MGLDRIQGESFMLEVVELIKRFKQGNVVNGVNLFLEKGETIGLLGPNGAGKSTTISMISTLIEPSSGDIRLNNESILKQPQALRKVLGVVPQEIALYQELSAKENLEFFARIHGLSGQGLKKRVGEVLELVGLTDRKKDLVKTFSGGMKRRLNIGVALLHEPELIIMDEPTVGIDPQSRNYILETVKILNKEKKMTVLYTSHYMEEVEFLCDRIYIMDRGKIIASGTKEEIKNILSTENTVIVKLERPHPDFEKALLHQSGVSSVSVQDRIYKIISAKEIEIFPILLQLSQNCNASIISLEIQNPTLEDVFLHLTGRVLRD